MRSYSRVPQFSLAGLSGGLAWCCCAWEVRPILFPLIAVAQVAQRGDFLGVPDVPTLAAAFQTRRARAAAGFRRSRTDLPTPLLKFRIVDHVPPVDHVIDQLQRRGLPRH